MSTGHLVVISGPSGVGKSTIIHKVREAIPSLRFSVSATTRPIRPNETDGADYYFVTKEAFEAMLANDELLEHNFYVGNYYGTPVRPIRDGLAEGENILLDIDPNGAKNVRKRFPDATLIYISPPSMEELARRLRTRGDTAEELILKRLERARWEESQIGFYDKQVINDDADAAAGQIIELLKSRFGETVEV